MQGGVRKKGETWYYYFEAGKVNGKRKKIERKGGRTKPEALKALRSAIAEFEGKGTFADESEISVADYFDYWHKEYVLVNCKYNTQETYKIVIEKHIKPDLGIYRLKSLNPSLLQEYFNRLFREGFAKSSLEVIRAILSGSLKMAVYPYKFLKENPMAYVKIPKYPDVVDTKEKLKTITLDDFEAIIKRYPEGNYFYIPFQIGFHTGLRPSEVCGLTKDCIDLKKKTLTVDKILFYKEEGTEWVLGTPKTKKSKRIIDIGETLIAILEKHFEKQEENKNRYGKHYHNSKIRYPEAKKHYLSSEFVCTKENGELVTMHSLKNPTKTINHKLGIDFSPHSLRHTHATMLLEAGASMKEIQERLGHSKLSTTMDTYSHVTPKMKKNTVDIFEKAIKKDHPIPPT